MYVSKFQFTSINRGNKIMFLLGGPKDVGRLTHNEWSNDYVESSSTGSMAYFITTQLVFAVWGSVSLCKLWTKNGPIYWNHLKDHVTLTRVPHIANRTVPHYARDCRMNWLQLIFVLRHLIIRQIWSAISLKTNKLFSYFGSDFHKFKFFFILSCQSTFVCSMIDLINILS